METGRLTWYTSFEKMDKRNTKCSVDLTNSAISHITEDIKTNRKLFNEHFSFAIYTSEEDNPHVTEDECFPILIESDSAAQKNEWIMALTQVVRALDHEHNGLKLPEEAPKLAPVYEMDDIDEDSYHPPRQADENASAAGESTTTNSFFGATEEDDFTLGSSANLRPVPETVSDGEESEVAGPTTLGARVQHGIQVSKKIITDAIGTRALDALRDASVRMSEEGHKYGRDDIRIFQSDEESPQTNTSTVALELKNINNPARRTMRRLNLYAASNGFQKLQSKKSVKTFLEQVRLLSNDGDDMDADIDPVLSALAACDMQPGMEWYEIIEMVRNLEERFQGHVDELNVRGITMPGDDDLLAEGRFLTATAHFPNDYEAEFDISSGESTREVTTKIAKAVAQLNVTEAFVRVNCGAAWEGKETPLLLAIRDLLQFLQESEKVMLVREASVAVDIGAMQEILNRKERTHTALQEEFQELSEHYKDVSTDLATERNRRVDPTTGAVLADSRDGMGNVSAAERRMFMQEKTDLIRQFNDEKAGLVRENQSIRYALNPASEKTAMDLRRSADKLHEVERKFDEANRRLKAMNGVPVGHDWHPGMPSSQTTPAELLDNLTSSDHHNHFSPEKWMQQYKNVLSRGSGHPDSKVQSPFTSTMGTNSMGTPIAMPSYGDEPKMDAVPSPHLRAMTSAPSPLSSRPLHDNSFDHVQAHTKSNLVNLRELKDPNMNRSPPPSPGPRAFHADTNNFQYKVRARLAMEGKMSEQQHSMRNPQDEAKTMLSAHRRKNQSSHFMGATTSFQVKKKVGHSPVAHPEPGFKYT